MVLECAIQTLLANSAAAGNVCIDEQWFCLRHHIYRDEEMKTKEASDKTNVHQCKHCFTIYDEEYGDEANQISPKTPFSALDPRYECPVCSAPKEDFTPIEKGSTLYAQM